MNLQMKRPFIFLLSVCLSLACLGWITARSQSRSDQELGDYAQVSYCDLVSHPKDYENKQVAISASYRYGFEWQELFCLTCRGQGKTWLEFDEKTAGAVRRSLRKAPRNHGIVNATFYGTFESKGPYGDGGYLYRFNVKSVKEVKVVYRDGRAPDLLPPEVQKQLCQ